MCKELIAFESGSAIIIQQSKRTYTFATCMCAIANRGLLADAFLRRIRGSATGDHGLSPSA